MPQSPKISHISWGKVNLEGIARQFKDVKLFPGGAREWDCAAHIALNAMRTFLNSACVHIGPSYEIRA